MKRNGQKVPFRAYLLVLRELSGERGGNRTYNLLIKSQLLCQLSYAPTL
jgi:hypothetical protein